MDVTAAELGDPERAALELLIAAGAPLALSELSGVLGPSARRTIVALAQLVESDGTLCRVRAGADDLVHAICGEPSPDAWRRLARIGRRMLAARPGDPIALVVSCRARARLGDATGGLVTLVSYPAARHQVDAATLAGVVRAIASSDPAIATDCHLQLARELIHRGDVETARRTLDELDATDAAMREVRAVRAEALVRAGALDAAHHELVAAGPPTDPDAVMMLAGIDLLRGNLARARTALLELRLADAHQPRLAGVRATAMALSYLLEERHALAVAWCRRARRACLLHGPIPPISLVNAVEVMALLGLDRVDQAVAFVARQARALSTEALADPALHGIEALLRAAIIDRRGDAQAALELGEVGQRVLHDRGDHVARAVVLRYLARTAIACGAPARAERYLRECEGIAAASDLGGVMITCELERARLAAMQGRAADARARIADALARSPRAPYVRIEAWAIAEQPGPPPCGELEGVTGYAALRAAERALAEARLGDAIAAAATARQWYEASGVGYELSRAVLCQAEAFARTGELDESARAIATCEALAAAGNYRAVLVAASLVAAYRADRTGEIEAYVDAMALARRRAGDELWDRALEAACRRVGLPGSPGGLAAAAPFAERVTRLGLARGRRRLAAEATRVYLLDRDEPCPRPLDVVLDLELGRVTTPRGTRRLHNQSQRLLAALIEAGSRGRSPEQLYLEQWGASSYHPLRHRSTVYMAISRLRSTMRDRATDALIEQIDGRYRVSPRVRSAIFHRLPDDDDDRSLKRASFDRSAPPSIDEHARRWAIPLGVARWECASILAELASR